MSERASPTLLFGRGTISREHASLRKTCQRLRAVCASMADEALRERDEVERLVAEFGRQLTSHFTAEESEAYFGTLVTDCPELKAPIAKLRAEHRAMAGRIEELQQLALAPDRGSELQQTLQKLLDQFELHERQENVLLQDFFLRDEGDGGQ